MNASAAPTQNWLNTGLDFSIPKSASFVKTNARRLKTVSSAQNAGSKSASSARRFANVAACRSRATSRQLLNAQTAAKWSCISSPRVRLSLPKPSCWRRFTVSNIKTRFGLKHFLADLFLREAVPALRGRNLDFIVPVPLHPVKQREREFNQAERFAKHLSAAMKIPVEQKNIATCHTNSDPDSAYARATRGKYARCLCSSQRCAFERRATDSCGRCFHNRARRPMHAREHYRRRRGRCLRLDSCARTLVLS